jgi:hypothetical protein
MIFSDIELGDVEGIKKAPRLRNLSGADVMISTKAFPPVNESFIHKHIESGAILYRVVAPQDLLDDDGGRLLASLSKMVSLGARTWQAMLLLDSSHEILDYNKYVRKMELWVDHGGSCFSTFGHSVTSFLLRREKDSLSDVERSSIIYPIYQPRKAITIIKDYRVTLATLPGVGFRGAEIVSKMIKDENLGDDLLTALWFLTDTERLDKSDGVWKKIRTDVRLWLGLPDGFDLDIKVKELNSTE